MTTDFNELGYLGDGIREFRETVVQNHKELFGLLFNLNTYSQKKKFEITVDSDNGQQVLSVSLLAKILNDIQSVYILSMYGLTQQGRIVLRSALESFFLLAKIAKDPKFVSTFIEADEINRLKLMNAANTHSHPVFNDLKKYATPTVIDTLKKDIAMRDIKPINLRTIAEDTGLGVYYDTVYRLLSLDVHSTVRSLEDYVATGVDGELKSFEWAPRDNDVPSTLALAIDIHLRSWGAITALFKLEIRTDLQEFTKQLEALQRKGAINHDI